jgi:hypothetical protein
MPTLVYRVKVSNVSIVFSSDQTGTDPKFVDLARDANILIMHLAVAAGVKNHPLHAAPDVVGRVAQEAGVGRRIVSHIGIFDLHAGLADLRKNYSGPLTVGGRSAVHARAMNGDASRSHRNSVARTLGTKERSPSLPKQEGLGSGTDGASRHPGGTAAGGGAGPLRRRANALSPRRRAPPP